MGLCKHTKEDQPPSCLTPQLTYILTKGGLCSLQPKGLSIRGGKGIYDQGPNIQKQYLKLLDDSEDRIENTEVKLTRESEFWPVFIYKLTHDNISILLQQFSLYGISYLKNSSKNFHDAVSWGEGWQRKTMDFGFEIL